MRLRRIEEIGPEELGHTTHGVKLCQDAEYVSLIGIDFNLIRNFVLLQNALQFMRIIDRYL